MLECPGQSCLELGLGVLKTHGTIVGTRLDMTANVHSYFRAGSTP